MQKKVFSVVLMVLCLYSLSSCYYKSNDEAEINRDYTSEQLDSINFRQTHLYGKNYNFLVKSDSMFLLRQQPAEMMIGLMTDYSVVNKNDHVVVADIINSSNSKGDSIWVQLARDQYTIGWIQESEMLKKVVPDDPISEFISIFSNTHLVVSLIIFCIIAAVYLMKKLLRQKAKIVHFNDINSFYPTLLCMIVGTSATFYSSIQLFAPSVWRHFYFYPTLNPFNVPFVLSIFLLSVWAMLIVSLAVVDETFSRLSVKDSVLYLLGLSGVCAINYIVFSIFTLYYIGYPLLALYYYFAISRYLRHGSTEYLCGNCGAVLSKKGRCPHCGAFNE